MNHRGYAKSLGLLVVIIVVASALIYMSMQSSLGWPDESRRVRHAAGFSIVKPDGWDEQLGFEDRKGRDNSIYIGDAKSHGIPAYIKITQLSRTPDREVLRDRGYAPGDFHGQPAWKLEQQRKRTWALTYVFISGGRWYEVALQRPALPPLMEYMPFLESFQAEPPPTTSATSQPGP